MLFAGGAALLYYNLRPGAAVNQPQPGAQQAPVATKTTAVRRGNLDVRLRVTGATTARTFETISAPKLRGPEGDRDMVLMRLAASGSFVKQGEVIAEFDPQALKDHLDDTIAGLRDRENAVKRREVETELDMERLLQSLRRSKGTLDKARLDLRTAEVRTGIDQELLKLRVEEAEAAYNEAQLNLPLKRQSHDAAVRITEISRIQEELHVERHEHDLTRFVLRAPIGGMVVLLTTHRSGGERVSYAVGDRVRPGTTFMQIIEPRSMQVEAAVNQSDSNRFAIGQEAVVEIDAYPGARYRGRLASIGALAMSSGRQQYFIRSVPVKVHITEGDQRIIPDLSASASVLIHREEDVLIAPASAVEQDNGKSYVQVKDDKGGFERRAVELGASSGAEVSILGGVAEGDLILVR
jgi:multidrug resistance efflux pump